MVWAFNRGEGSGDLPVGSAGILSQAGPLVEVLRAGDEGKAGSAAGRFLFRPAGIHEPVDGL